MFVQDKVIVTYNAVGMSDLWGREGTRIAFDYAPKTNAEGPNGAKYSGTIRDFKATADGRNMVVMDVDDGRGVRQFDVGRMSYVDILA